MIFRGFLTALALMFVLWDGPTYSQEATAPIMTVEEAVIATGVESLTPVNPGNVFDASVGRLYCFTRIKSSLQPAVVKHLWFHGDKMVMEVTLPVKSSNWRTYSMKTILTSADGDWKVDVTSEDGTVLKTLTFTIR
ncbi:MAG: DUF2914 domain-containing protein [Nitrospirae bacterium]|nr:DUF2914 domain-containing protein [Nitrospirota bacterium]